MDETKYRKLVWVIPHFPKISLTLLATLRRKLPTRYLLELHTENKISDRKINI